MLVKSDDRKRFRILVNSPVNELSMNALGLLTWALLSNKKEYTKSVIIERFRIGDDLWKSISTELEQKGYLKRLNKTVLFSEVKGRFDSACTLYKKEERPNDFTLISGEAHKELSITTLGVWRSFMTGRNYAFCKNTIQTKFNLSNSRTDKIWEELSDKGYRVGKNIHEISIMKKREKKEIDPIELIESETLWNELIKIWGTPIDPLPILRKCKQNKWHKWSKEKKIAAIDLLKSYSQSSIHSISAKTWLSVFINGDSLDKESIDHSIGNKITKKKGKGGPSSGVSSRKDF